MEYLIACFGLTQILMYGSILNEVRASITRIAFFKKLLECSLCVGFHVGWFIGLFRYDIISQYCDIMIFAFASAGFCFFFDRLLEFILSSTPHDE